MSLARWSAMRRQGWEVQTHVGAFYLDPSVKDDKLVSAAAKAVEKYCRHYEKLGWSLESKPKVEQVPAAEPVVADVRLDTKGDILLVSRQPSGTMPVSSPFNRPGLHRYVIRAVWTHPPLPTKVEVPDEKLRRWLADGTMPVGARIL